MDECVFCKIISGKIPCSKVYEDGHCMAFLSIRPNAKGHTLVVPKDHSTDIFDIDQNTWLRIAAATKKVAVAVKGATGAEGINIITNNRAAAGQEVMHIHTHIVPRMQNDGALMWGNHRDYLPDEMRDFQKKIEAFLKD